MCGDITSTVRPLKMNQYYTVIIESICDMYLYYPANQLAFLGPPDSPPGTFGRCVPLEYASWHLADFSFPFHEHHVQQHIYRFGDYIKSTVCFVSFS